MKFSDETAKFHECIWPHRVAVLRVARILAGDDFGDDLAQEVMLKAYRGIDGFRAGSDAKAWLMTILRRTRIDHIRSSNSESDQISLEQLNFEPVESTERIEAESRNSDEILSNPESVLSSFSNQQVIDALKKLPEEIRLTLLLVDVEGLDQQEVARILEVPVGTIKSRAHRGRGMLREQLLPVARRMRLTTE